MTRYGSDKGLRRHNYTTIYPAIFKGRRGQPLRTFEPGVGTNNPDMASSMGVTGSPGVSLRGWRDLFPRALVHGADICRDILLQEDRIKTFYCDRLDQAPIRDLWSRHELQSGADAIVEDGLHAFEANVSFPAGSLHHLRPGGMNVIEDISRETAAEWYDRLETVHAKQSPGFEFAFVGLPDVLNPYDNNLLVIRGGSG